MGEGNLLGGSDVILKKEKKLISLDPIQLSQDSVAADVMPSTRQ